MLTYSLAHSQIYWCFCQNLWGVFAIKRPLPHTLPLYFTKVLLVERPNTDCSLLKFPNVYSSPKIDTLYVKKMKHIITKPDKGFLFV